MNCLEFRRAAGADPSRLEKQAQAHRDACPACAEYHRSLVAMDATILRAVQVPVTPAAPSAAPAPARTALMARNRWLALAASIVAGVLVGSLLWVGGPRASLARELVEHVNHEPEAFASSHVDRADVERVLRADHLRLRSGIDDVSYANSCPFRGHVVPHLVVRTPQGPVTVLVLRHEQLNRPMQLREAGFVGTLVPAGPGSIAILGDPQTDIADVTARLLASLEWTES
jgi:Protein of unknown function (DUF3379)